MTILLTGGSGFLGSHIAEQLSAAGRRVRALVRKTSDTSLLAKLPHVELFEASMEDAEGLGRAAEGVDAIIHAAGLVKARSAEEFHRVNAAGTASLVAAAVRAEPRPRRFVLVSSLTAIGPSDARGTPVTPATGPHPVTRYGRSKLAGERAALEHRDDLSLVIVRPPALYGPRDREFFAFFQAVKSRILPYTGSPDGQLSMSYGPDAASACIAAVDADVPSGSAYFIDDGEVYTLAELGRHIEAALGTRALVRFPLPQALLRVAATATEAWGKATDRPMMFTPDKCNELFEQWVCDASATGPALGWQPKVKFAEGAALTAAWYRREGWL
jgi:nucleoside-diphosphate-sugar epimerase